ncbi:MAG TPA: hypothetical protein DIU15_10320, partial [Deltaproteobacteria bacterium]|nr:hypothetical protein [Deltaproteobacteria bacterium]
MHLANLPPIAALVLLVTSLGCMSADESLAESKSHRQAGDRAAEEEALRDGLERHPDDVDLLMATAELYLRPKPEEQYKPRLALHYAMRADRAARRTSPEAAALLHRAYRAAGGFEEAEVLLGKALETIGHPDAGNPSHPEPVDPDLL